MTSVTVGDDGGEGFDDDAVVGESEGAAVDGDAVDGERVGDWVGSEQHSSRIWYNSFCCVCKSVN